METIKEILIRRDQMTVKEAEELIGEAKNALHDRLMEGEMAYDICEEYFGLEPDYIMELL